MAENDPQGSTQEYTVIRTDGRDEGIEQIPTADGDCKLVRLHGPIEVVIVDWTAIRSGAAPIVPHPDAFEPNLVFLRGQQGKAVPMTKGDGGHSWMMTGQYVYAKKQAKGLDQDMPTGKVPWAPGGPNDNTISKQNLSKQVMGS